MNFADFKTKALTHPVPRQYYAGQRRHAVELPDNIIIYARSEMPERRNLQRGLAHHRHVLFFVLDGHGSVLVGSERFVVSPGQMIFIPPHREHLMLSDEKGICFLYVSFEMAESAIYEKFANRPIEMVDGIEKYLDDLLDCHIGENSEDIFHATRAALDILQILNCLAECDAVSGRLLSAPPEQQFLIDRINRYLYANLGKTLDIEELSRLFGYSPTHLRRLYRNFMGMTLGEYFRGIRHARAQTLLRQQTVSIGKIAESCGFSSRYAFSAAFRQREKCTPGEFRRKFQKK